MSVICIHTETRRYLQCPSHCDGRLGGVDHLLDGPTTTAGPWFCSKCGRGWSFSIGKGSVSDLVEADHKFVDATVLLVLPPQTMPVYFTVHTKHIDDDEFEDRAYFYDEHTCPTNWIREVVEIKFGDSNDPHRLFRFVGIERGLDTD